MVIPNISSMNSFRVQPRLCDYSNGNLVPYPRSEVMSDIFIDGKFCYLSKSI